MEEKVKLPSGWITTTTSDGLTINLNTKELVMCKDCKHWYPDADCGMACEFTNMSQPEDGYCNWGEVKKDGMD